MGKLDIFLLESERSPNFWPNQFLQFCGARSRDFPPMDRHGWYGILEWVAVTKSDQKLSLQNGLFRLKNFCIQIHQAGLVKVDHSSLISLIWHHWDHLGSVDVQSVFGCLKSLNINKSRIILAMNQVDMWDLPVAKHPTSTNKKKNRQKKTRRRLQGRCSVFQKLYNPRVESPRS